MYSIPFLFFFRYVLVLASHYSIIHLQSTTMCYLAYGAQQPLQPISKMCKAHSLFVPCVPSLYNPYPKYNQEYMLLELNPLTIFSYSLHIHPCASTTYHPSTHVTCMELIPSTTYHHTWPTCLSTVSLHSLTGRRRVGSPSPIQFQWSRCKAHEK
jgi:hypothetical protein